MNVSHIVASAVAGAAAVAALAAPAMAAGPADAENALAPVGTTLDAVTSEAGLHWGATEANGGAEGGNSSADFGSAYGDAVFFDKHSSLVASYGAPLVDVDARCVDAMGGIGGYGNGVLGNSAKCNLKDVQQIDDSNGLIG